jgi:inorganic pyrophosphatase
MFRMRDEKGSDEKILCVPLRDPMWSYVTELDDLRPELLAEIEHFFRVYKDLEGKEVVTEGFATRQEALTVIAESRARSARRP